MKDALINTAAVLGGMVLGEAAYVGASNLCEGVEDSYSIIKGVCKPEVRYYRKGLCKKKAVASRNPLKQNLYHPYKGDREPSVKYLISKKCVDKEVRK